MLCRNTKKKNLQYHFLKPYNALTVLLCGMYGLFVQSFSIVSSIVPSVVVLDNSPVEFLRYLHKRVNSPATNIIKTYQVRGGV